MNNNSKKKWTGLDSSCPAMIYFLPCSPDHPVIRIPWGDHARSLPVLPQSVLPGYVWLQALWNLLVLGHIFFFKTRNPPNPTQKVAKIMLATCSLCDNLCWQPVHQKSSCLKCKSFAILRSLCVTHMVICCAGQNSWDGCSPLEAVRTSICSRGQGVTQIRRPFFMMRKTRLLSSVL